MNNYRQQLKGFKIFVTAGPTPVEIDKVRIVTNKFTATTGYNISVLAAEMGANVILLLGPHHIENSDILVNESRLDIEKKIANILASKARIESSGGSIKIERYSYFRELMALTEKYIPSQSFDAVIHSAAVADYAPIAQKGKIKSNLEKLNIEMAPTPKIIKKFKVWDPDIFQVQFKLEVGLSEKDLIETAYQSLLKNKSDLVVANNMPGTSSDTAAAYIIDQARKIQTVKTREMMYIKILEEVGKRLGEKNK